MGLAPDALENYHRVLARRIRNLLVAMGVVEVGGFVAIAWLVLGSGTSDLLWVLVYLAVVWPLGTIGFALLIRRASRQTLAFLQALRPRIRALSNPSGRGTILLFDNDLTLQVQTGPAFFWLFYSAAGNVITPDLAEATKWTRTVRFGRVTSSTAKRGDPSLQSEIREFESRFGTRWTRLQVRERRNLDPADARAPARDVVMILVPRDLTKRGERLLSELDRIRDLLERARATSPSVLAS